MRDLLGVSIFIIIAGAILAYLGVPYMGIVIVIGVVVFLIWLFQRLVGQVR